MIVAVNEIASKKFTPTAKTTNKCDVLLDYAHTYPNPIIRYHTSDVCLHMDFDVTYLFKPKARSRVTGRYYYCTVLYSKPHITTIWIKIGAESW